MTYLTLDDLITNSTRFDINKITFYTRLEDLIILDTTVFEIYRRFINPYIGTYNTKPAHREKYERRPHLLSADIYGTPDLAWLILMLNDKESPSNFKLRPKLRLISTANLDTIYDSLVAKNSDSLIANWNEYLIDLDS